MYKTVASRKNKKEIIKMKRIISTILVAALLVCMMLTLASCGKTLNGTYSREEDGMKVTYTFKKDGTFEATMDTGILGDVEIDGEYVIDGDKIEMTYEFLDVEYDEEYDFEKGRGYIEIDGDKYEKE